MPSSSDFGFVTGACPSGRVRLRGFRGREAVSELSRFELWLEVDGGLSPEEQDRLLQSPCAIAMGPGPGDVLRGLLTRTVAVDRTRDEPFRLLATMTPTMHLLTLGRTNRIYQHQTILEIAATIFAKYKLAADVDYRFAVRASLPRREYVVQYEESDWDFLQRWLEYEGLTTWFEHGSVTDTLVVSDVGADAPDIAAPERIAYREKNNLATSGEATVFDWTVETQRVPARVVLFDYNYRTPHVRLAAKAGVPATGAFGTVMSYGEHFKDSDDGDRLARVRAERLACEHRTFRGRSDAPRLRAGHVVTLFDHHERAHDGKYFVTSVAHRGGEVPGVSGEASATYERYENAFEALPANMQFRPSCRTPWPSVHGIMHGHIAADGDGLYAEMDELGRYRVKLPFDTSGAQGQASSRWIRMAQSYAGSREGTHHPLRKGTEVLVAFIDGDPDRPILVGAVPNLHTQSPTTARNATQAVHHTPSGMRIEMEDRAAALSAAEGRETHG